MRTGVGPSRKNPETKLTWLRGAGDIRLLLFPLLPHNTCVMTRAPSVIINHEATVKMKMVFRVVKQKVKAARVSDIRRSHCKSPRLGALGSPSMALEELLL